MTPPIDRPGTDKPDITVQFSIRGRFDAGSFPDWICHRAGVLDLSGWVREIGSDLITVMVSGDAVLVDAMELACSLGPGDILVEHIQRNPGNQHDVPHRSARAF